LEGMPITNLLTVAYLASAVLFILSLGGLSTQSTARRGNFYGVAGMLLAFGATFLDMRVHPDSVQTVAVPGAMGGLVGAILALRVAMTSMPELVALLHSFVGLAAVLVGISTALGGHDALLLPSDKTVHDMEIFLDVGIGSITFTGSIVAWAKLS